MTLISLPLGLIATTLPKPDPDLEPQMR